MASRTVRGALKVALVLCVFAAFWNGACGTTDVKPKPNIQVNPGTIGFKDSIGSPSPAPQTVAVSTDQGTVTGLRADISYSGTVGWLTVALSDTIAPAVLTLTSSIANLPPATYQATVTLSANEAGNSPVTLPVTFEVSPPPPVKIALSTTAISMNDTAGTSSPAPQTVAITADGIGTLSGLTASVDYASGAAGWLSTTLSSTTAPATLTITATNGGLNASTYRATVSVAAAGAGNSPQAVSVTYAVAAPPPVTGVTVVFTANLGRCGSELAQETANVIRNANPTYIFMMGSSVYPATGTVTTLQDYMNCYDPVFGQWKDHTYATLGDHEVDIDSIPPDFGTGMAAGADAYFGADHVGPPGKNWQSFDIAGWHVVALNVQTPGGYKRPPQIAYHAGSPQLNWLINDLRSHSNKCTLGVWYESMWFSGTHITNPNDPLHKDDYRIQDVRGVWTALYDNNADLVVNGWPRIYERFAPMFYANGYQHPTTSEWAADPVRGIRQITSGLGGDGPITADSAVVRLPTSEYRSGGNGVLKVTLGDGEYSWEFLNTKYSHIQDSGRGTCH